MAARPDLAVIVETITVNFNRVRRRNPLIHHISNWVTLNDCANAAYAVGARPTMAFDPQEAILATNQADAIVWNLGTFNKTTASAIQSALLSAATRPIPVVIDPVAAQAYPGRLHFALDCLAQFAVLAEQGKLACTLFIRGNETELTALTQSSIIQLGLNPALSSGGVDHCRKDVSPNMPAPFGLTPFSAKLSSYQLFLASFPANMALFLVETGKRDHVLFLNEGQLDNLTHVQTCPSLALITGAGCVSDTLIAATTGALLSKEPELARRDLAAAAFAAVAGLVRAGQLANEKAGGIGTFRSLLFDELSRLG